MKQSFDDEMKREFEALNSASQMSSTEKERMKRTLQNGEIYRHAPSRRSILPKVVFLLLLCTVAFTIYFLVPGTMPQQQTQPLVDQQTPIELTTATGSADAYLIDWKADAMDRGNHNFNTDFHGKLIVEPNFSTIDRGDPVYFKMPKVELENPDALLPATSIARIVGLPGETVEIKKGQVYINGQPLDAFYGRATMHGLTEDAYFKKIDAKRIESEQQTRAYFNTDLKAVRVKENAVFVLVDEWWRGIDSQDFGLLPLTEIEGVIIGHEAK